MSRVISAIQYILMTFSYLSCRLLFRKDYKLWVIGTDEMAGIIHNLGRTLMPSITVVLQQNRYYDFQYTYILPRFPFSKEHVVRLIWGPLLLGYLCSKFNNFIYIWHTGFLQDREIEFRFLKSINIKIVNIFVGSDIRSPKLLIEKCKKLGMETFVSYLPISNNIGDSYEQKKIQIASISDKYADYIFSAPVDQISYLKSKQYPFIYMYDEEKMHFDQKKFELPHRIRVLHAPTNPIIKGTPLVHCAIRQLKMKGYDFDYIELKDTDHATVMTELKKAHIVLNQFYAFMPGVFGIEAMANHCAVLMSADSNIEKILPNEGNSSWMVTRYWEIADNIEILLNSRILMKQYADNGYALVKKHYTYDAARRQLLQILNN